MFSKIGVVVLLMPFLTSCGVKNAASNPKTLDIVKQYLLDYKNVTGKAFPEEALNNGTIDLVDTLPAAIAGQCSTWSNGSWAIILNNMYWEYAREEQRITLLYHELGHCLQGMDHRGKYDGKNFTSLMHPYTLPIGMFTSAQKAYVNELHTKIWSL